MSNIYVAPVYKIKELNNIFIELTAKNCNQRCKSCYIDFPLNKSVKDFIPIEKIKEAIADTKDKNLYCIYLLGAEPMTHPEFNSILRLCLKRCNVCICTNGSFLNEKKIRFLKKVEDEGEFQIFFKLSLTHFDELENDRAKYRGNFRQTIFALKVLNQYNFTSVLAIQNFYKLNEKMLKTNFEKILNEHNLQNIDLQIYSSFSKEENENIIDPSPKTDCMFGRVLTTNGVYICPFLTSDYRGRTGVNFKNFSETFMAETNFCSLCSKNKKQIFSIG